MKTSVRNRVKGVVKEILRGQVMCEVDIDTPAGIISAVITTRSLDELGLAVGDPVFAGVKATNVFLETA